MSNVLAVAIRKRLRDFTLEVEFNAPPGVTLILGESGAGKTTLLRSIAGLLHPDGGKIALNGTVLDNGPHHVAPEKREIGFVFQDYALFPHLTVAQNVRYGLDARRLSSAEREARLKRTLSRLGIAHLAGAYPSKISGGEQQRVALARGLVIEPRALLLDEPLASLDPQTRVRVRAELGAVLADLNIPTLLVSHDESDHAAFPGRVAHLERGRLR